MLPALTMLPMQRSFDTLRDDFYFRRYFSPAPIMPFSATRLLERHSAAHHEQVVVYVIAWAAIRYA